MWPLSQFEIEVEHLTSRREIKRAVYSLSLCPLFSPRSYLPPTLAHSFRSLSVSPGPGLVHSLHHHYTTRRQNALISRNTGTCRGSV